jgi:DNA polymerase kappa
MSYSALDRRRIYLACRPIFAGNNALLRKPKKIRELLLMHLKSIQPLVQDFSIETVADIVKVLLERRIFQSDVKAKLEFPELFHSSPARDAQRATSENDAARSVAEALEEVASREDNSKSDDEEQEALEDAIQNSNNVQLVFDEDSTPKEQPLHNISLYPTFFPYRAQHAILSKVQSVLEDCCFEFVRKWQPSILEDRAWDCAAAVELTKWTRMLAKKAEKFPEHAFKIGNASLNEILFATHKLRHTAVHRLPTTCLGVEALVKSAVILTETLQDPLRTAKLEDLRLEVDSKIKSMELNKNFLESTLSQELQKIQRQRDDLDLQEKELRERITRDDCENKIFIGDLLEDCVIKLFDVEPISPGDADQISDDGED